MFLVGSGYSVRHRIVRHLTRMTENLRVARQWTKQFTTAKVAMDPWRRAVNEVSEALNGLFRILFCPLPGTLGRPVLPRSRANQRGRERPWATHWALKFAVVPGRPSSFRAASRVAEGRHSRQGLAVQAGDAQLVFPPHCFNPESTKSQVQVQLGQEQQHHHAAAAANRNSREQTPAPVPVPGFFFVILPLQPHFIRVGKARAACF